MLIKRGDIVRVLFPNSDLLTSKRRPAIVVQRDDLDSGISQVLLAMITSNMHRGGHPSRVTVLLDSSQGNRSGLRLDSIIMTDNIVTVRENEIDSVLGHFPQMDKVDQALRYSFGLDGGFNENNDE